jgi:hypothetical protein
LNTTAAVAAAAAKQRMHAIDVRMKAMLSPSFVRSCEIEGMLGNGYASGFHKSAAYQFLARIPRRPIANRRRARVLSIHG